ncbi:hypothetical protein D3C75_1257610 [compost metagenome]
MPGNAVRVFGAGDRCVAAGQGQAGTEAGEAAHRRQGIDIFDVGAGKVGDDGQQCADQGQRATWCAAHEGGDQQRGEHGEAEFRRHQQTGLGFV